MLYPKKIKPSLIDQNIIGEYMREKLSQQIAGSGVQAQSELQKLSTKIFYNIVNFIYHYFFIICILVGIGYYMYNRYLWYQQIKKNQIKKEDQTKKFFDEIMDGNETKSQPQIQTPVPHQIQTSVPHQIQTPVQHQIQTPVQISSSQVSQYFIPGKKLDKVIGGNNGYLNHMRQTWDTTHAHTPSMGRISSNVKTVRFAQGEFDAYGRNNINPKTGETLVKQVIVPPIDQNNDIQPYSGINNSYSSF